MAETGTDATFFAEENVAITYICFDVAAKETISKEQGPTANEPPQVAADEYLQDTKQHMRNKQIETLPNVNLIDLQPEFEWLMRMDLVDFLVEAHGALALLPETLSLAVNFLDRYSTECIVHKCHCAFVSFKSLLIEAKYGDLRDNVAPIDKLKVFCRGFYTTGMLCQMEIHILNIFEWDVCHRRSFLVVDGGRKAPRSTYIAHG